MIYLRAFRVVVTPSGRNRLNRVGGHIAKWENTHEFNFDILKPEEWRKYLSKMKTRNDKLLPKITKDGERLVYEVYFWGTPRYIKDHFGTTGTKNSYAQLFPGYEKDLKTKKDLATYGRLNN